MFIPKEVFSELQIFLPSAAILVLSHLEIPHLEAIKGFTNTYEVFSKIHKYSIFCSLINYHHFSITHTCFHKCLKKVKSQSKIFYIWQPHLFFHTYDHLCILCLAEICLFLIYANKF